MKTRALGLLWRVAIRYERQLRTGQTLLRALLRTYARLLRSLPGSSRSLGPPRRATGNSYAWGAATPDVAVTDVSPAWEVNRPRVQTDSATIPHEFVDSMCWPMPQTFVLELPRGRLWGDAGVPISNDDVVLADQTNDFLSSATDMAVQRKLWLGRPATTRGVVATINGFYAQSYCHWMFDLLPRLDILRTSGVAYDALMAPTATAFQRETLLAAGFDAGTVLDPVEHGHAEFERLVVPSLPGTQGQSPPAVCTYLRELFADSVAGQPQSRRLYLSRADTHRRKLGNESELYESLAVLGFESITMSGMSVADQARTLAQAEIVVAPHGGALTNIVFCQPGTTIIEMFSPGYTPVCFWTITDAIGLDYRALFGEAAPGTRGVAKWSEYHVDPARVHRQLAALGVA